MRYNANPTNELIEIGSSKKPLLFSFGVIHFKNIGDIMEQGRIVSDYIGNDSFLLLPRNEIIFEDEVYYTSLLLMYSEDKLGQIKVDQLYNMINQQTNIYIQENIVVDNGAKLLNFQNSPVTDKNACYSYLISHHYDSDSQNYTYRISSSTSFRQHFVDKEDRWLGETLDLVFTGRNSTTDGNRNYRTYRFNGYKIKEIRVQDGGQVILSDVKGTDKYIDSLKINGVTLVSFLLDWHSPIRKSLFGEYYNGMEITIINFYPEKVLTATKTNIKYKNETLNSSPEFDIVIPENDEIWEQMKKLLGRNRGTTINQIWVDSKITLDEVLERFETKRIQKAKNNFEARRRDLSVNIQNLKREIRETQLRKMMLEEITKEFIPMPEIIIPENPSTDNPYIYDLLKEVNGKYYIKEGELN